MPPVRISHRIQEAAAELNRVERRDDGERIALGLAGSLERLCERLYDRVHKDVESSMGTDSLLMPVSELRSRQLTFEQVAVFEAAESAALATAEKYIASPGEWFADWVAGLLLGSAAEEERLRSVMLGYLGEEAEARRLAFSNALVTVLAEASRAPLVLFRLFPLATQVATALAFGDATTAQALRKKQRRILPDLADCRECGGALLQPDVTCPQCGNPLWVYRVLTMGED